MKLSDEELIGKLSKHTFLRDRVEGLLDIVENPDGRFTRADDAEEQVTVELRSLGNEMLREWAQDASLKSEKAVLNSGVVVKKKSKKSNSPATPF